MKKSSKKEVRDFIEEMEKPDKELRKRLEEMDEKKILKKEIEKRLKGK